MGDSAMGVRAAVFLDRDGVLVVPEFRDGRSFAPRRLEDFGFYDAAKECVERLKAADYRVVVVTNQPDVGNGLVAQSVVEEMHRRLRLELSVDEIQVCYHSQDDACTCRKPLPGMLLDAAKRLGLDLSRSVMIGDRASDVDAGIAAGCRTVFIDLGYREPRPERADFVVTSLSEATEIVLNEIQEGGAIMRKTSELGIKVFADGADFDQIVKLSKNPLIKGFTTNPTLMRKAGISDYESFAHKVLQAIPDRPVSFEVFADDFPSMIAQGRRIASWGPNTRVNVKIPVSNTEGRFCGEVIETLSRAGAAVNVTALMTPEQVESVAKCIAPGAPAIISVFAGRVADTGRDPVPLMQRCLEILKPYPNIELLWASPRELLNIFQADDIGCHIITVTNDVLAKLELVGKDLDEYSLDTVKMFYRDAMAAGYSISEQPVAA